MLKFLKKIIKKIKNLFHHKHEVIDPGCLSCDDDYETIIKRSRSCFMDDYKDS